MADYEPKKKEQRPPPPPLTEKEWIFYHSDLTTSVMVALSKDRIAVARSYMAETDRYSKRKGRSIALQRLRNLLPLFLQKKKPFQDGQTNYCTTYKSGIKAGHILFEVVSPGELYDEEEQFFNDTILKKFLDLEQTMGTPEVLIALPEAAGEGPVVV